jgi:hypothetical protein
LHDSGPRERSSRTRKRSLSPLCETLVSPVHPHIGGDYPVALQAFLKDPGGAVREVVGIGATASDEKDER